MTKYISAENLLILFPALFVTALGMALHSLGWPLWVCIVGPGILGIASWGKTARKHDELVRAAATASEIEWFVRKTLLFHILLGSATVGAYLVTAHYATKKSSVASYLARQYDAGPYLEIHDPAALSKASRVSPTPWWLYYPPEKKGLLGALRYGAALLVWAIVYFVGFPILFFQMRQEPRFRGRRILTQEEADAESDFIVPKGARRFLFGGVYLPWEALVRHIAILGAPGQGKTILLRLLLQSILPFIKRAMICNPKGDMISILHGMGVGARVKIANPMDLRGVAWDLSRDITDPESARALADILFPVDRNATQQFFAKAVQVLAQEVIIALFGTNWELSDVVYGMTDQRRLCKILSQTERGKELIALYFAKPATAQDIMNEVANKTDPYIVVAAAWQRAPEKLSIREFVKSDQILVFGSSHAAKAAVDAINQAKVQFASQLLLDGPEVDTLESLMGVDEVRHYLEALVPLALEGRSKGVCVLVDGQDIEDMRETYGERIANVLLSQCSSKAFLGLQSAETARWAAQILGEFEAPEGEKGLVKRESLLSSQLMNLPPTNPTNGLWGFYVTPHIGAYLSVLPGDWIKDNLCPKAKDVPDFVPRPTEHQYLKPWTEDDLRRLGLDEDDDSPVVPSEPDVPPNDPPVPIRILKVLNPKKRR